MDVVLSRDVCNDSWELGLLASAPVCHVQPPGQL